MVGWIGWIKFEIKNIESSIVCFVEEKQNRVADRWELCGYEWIRSF